MNEIIIEGRLAQNPEKKQAKTGTTMTTFNVASDRMMDKGNIDYFHCISFGQTADYVQQYGATGMAIIVIGECQLSNYTDKNGHKQTGINIIVSRIKFLTRNPKTGNPADQLLTSQCCRIC